MDEITDLKRRLQRLEARPPSSMSNRVARQIIKTGIADNTSTPIFTITTTNESGNNDGGVFICQVTGLTSHAASFSAGYSAVKRWRGSFSRAMNQSGSGVNTAVEDIFSGASAATSSANRDIGTITMTVAETSEYIQTVSFTIDLTGTNVSTAGLVLLVEVLYQGFLTPPVIAPV